MIPLVASLAVGAILLVAIVIFVVKIKRRSRPGSSAPLPAAEGTSVRAPLQPEIMAGGLQHMALADLLQFLAQGGHSGTLQITSGRRSGSIRMVQGLVVHAEFRREQDLPALFELLSLQIGDFHFRFETPPSEPVRGREVVDILMLCLARKEDLK